MTSRPPHRLMRINLYMGPARQVQSDKELRLIYQVDGGTFEGERLNGHVVPTTGDWVGVIGNEIKIDVRVKLVTDDGAEILVSYEGLDPMPADSPLITTGREVPENGDYYFRVSPRMQTTSPQYQWLTRMNVYGVGTRRTDGVVYDIFENVPADA